MIAALNSVYSPTFSTLFFFLIMMNMGHIGEEYNSLMGDRMCVRKSKKCHIKMDSFVTFTADGQSS